MKEKILVLTAILALVCVYVAADSAQMSVTVTSTAGPTVDSVSITPDDDFSTVGIQVYPVQNSDKTITITADISDINGWDDISTVSAAFTSGNPTNGNPTMSISDCIMADADTITCTKTYDMTFYDPALTYTIEVTAKDASNNQGTGTASFDYTTLIALELDASGISFGHMDIGSTRDVFGDQSMLTVHNATIQNQGNGIIDVFHSATNFSGFTDSFDASQGEIQVGTNGYTALSNSLTRADLDLVFGASSTEKIDFRLTIPVGALPETYTSTVTLTAVIG
ncbi:hypothetical protein GF323_01310 [Candidatus Woesearchaeota archaeon]|nr:hypothetical protein [Candidatus Woesearchaeota archaeon]